MYPENAQTRTRDVRGGMLPPSQRKSDVEKGTIGGIGESLLKGMGWREGKGIGDRNKVISHFYIFFVKGLVDFTILFKVVNKILVKGAY